MTLPKLTKKQHAILTLLYTYRFLDRVQIQTFMHHKDYKLINLWLKDLREKHYVAWIYSTDFLEKTKPAIYYLGINGIRLLKSLAAYPIEALRKRYRDKGMSRTFIDSCLLLADCCLMLEHATTDTIRYTAATEAGYLYDDVYDYVTQCEYVHPHLVIAKTRQHKRTGRPLRTTRFLVEIFDTTLPQYRIRTRLGNYIQYLDDEEWNIGDDVTEAPTILFICPDVSRLIYAKRRIRTRMADVWYGEDREDICIMFATVDNIRKYGITEQAIWERAKPPTV